MPAGVSWASYLKMFAASLLAMCAGAEVVHRYYRPDLTIPEIPPQPGELKTELLGLKERQHEPQNSSLPRTLVLEQNSLWVLLKLTPSPRCLTLYGSKKNCFFSLESAAMPLSIPSSSLASYHPL